MFGIIVNGLWGMMVDIGLALGKKEDVSILCG